jgi:thiamine-phosphate pyrophosphorylase
MSPMEAVIILPAGISVSDIDWSLYAIIDAEWLQDRPIQDICKQIIRGGAGIVQYRDKVSESGEFYRNAEKIRKITKQNNVPLIINDQVDIAVAVEADGVHLGHRDLPLVIARRLIKRHMLIGGSV